MLSIHPVAILIAPKAFGGPIRAPKSSGQTRVHKGMLIGEYRKRDGLLMVWYKLFADLKMK